MKFLSSAILFLSAQPTMVFGSSSIHGGGGVSKEQQHESEEKATFGRVGKPDSRELKGVPSSQSYFVRISSDSGVSSVEKHIRDKSGGPGKTRPKAAQGDTSVKMERGFKRFTRSQRTKVNGISSTPAIGYLVIKIESGNNFKDAIEEVKALGGVLTVEVDAEQEVFRNVRGTSPQEQVHDAMEILKKGGEHLQQRRSLAEETPYGIGMVNVTGLWDIAPQQHVKICVVDTGYGLGHVDLPTSPKVTGFSPYAETNAGEAWDEDGHGHGSHCAGTIGAIGSNNAGVVGVIPDFGENFSFHIGKGLTDSGSGTSSGVLAAVQSCVDAGAKVISMSLGGGSYSMTAAAEYQDHYDDGVFIIAAAGNGGDASLLYPASYASVMSVAAVDSYENRATFSQYNDQVEIAAPGVAVKSTLPGDNYASWSGTSMACPHVAGVAALLMSHFPNCEVNQIRNAMIRSAGVDQYTNWYDNKYGWGIVNAGAAYDLLLTGCEEAGGKSPSDMNLLAHEMGVGGKDQKTLGCINNDQCLGMGGFTCDTDNNICVDPISTPPTPPPTPAPPCLDTSGSLGTSVDLDLLTDNWGSETAWTLTKPDDSFAVGGGYVSNSESTETFCLGDGLHTFTITDSYGDGICCDYGQGSYTITAGGVELISGGDFGSVESKNFTISSSPTTPPPVLPPTPPPVLPPTPPPTPSPILPPTPPPTISPTPPPTPSPTLEPTSNPTSNSPTTSPTSEEYGAGHAAGHAAGFIAGRYAAGYDAGFADGKASLPNEAEE